jgi:ribosome-associated protein
LNQKALTLEIYKALDDKKGLDIKILDVQELTSISDYFIIATGTSTKHASALADSVEEALSELGYEPSHKEGHRHGEWILLDYLDVIIHVFTDQTRSFYQLEKMWQDAKILDVSVDSF